MTYSAIRSLPYILARCVVYLQRFGSSSNFLEFLNEMKEVSSENDHVLSVGQRFPKPQSIEMRNVEHIRYIYGSMNAPHDFMTGYSGVSYFYVDRFSCVQFKYVCLAIAPSNVL